MGTLTPPSPHFLISEVGNVRSHYLAGFCKGEEHCLAHTWNHTGCGCGAQGSCQAGNEKRPLMGSPARAGGGGGPHVPVCLPPVLCFREVGDS